MAAPCLFWPRTLIRGGASLCSIAALILLACVPSLVSAQEAEIDLSFDPPSYAVYRAVDALEIDGKLDEDGWQAAPWTDPFVDIEGSDSSAPRYETRAKMLWDDNYLYIAAELEEPDVWATFTERDAPIYHDNAFEVFIDPTGDTHNYYELEVNALETVWDLMLVRPHRDGGPSISAWDIRGLEVGVQVDGTLNEPGDSDEGWTVEMALPWAVLQEAAPERRPPRDGEQWRLNFARAQWQLDVVDGAYEKDEEVDADWWVWAPHGAVNMHMPECWGMIEFVDAPAGTGSVSAGIVPDERVKWALRQLYYRQRAYHDEHGRYASDLAELNDGEVAVDGVDFEPELEATESTYEITAPGVEGDTIHIRHDGRVWISAE